MNVFWPCWDYNKESSVPYFKWKGVDIEGRVHKGLMKARSHSYLHETLLQNGIGALWVTQKKSSSFTHPIGSTVIANFFRHLTILLQADLFLDHALDIASCNTKNKRLKEIIIELQQEVKAGNSLSFALALYPDLFDPITIQLIATGQETGNLIQSLSMIADMGQMRTDFYKKIRSALVMPFLTALFFIILVVFILVMIVPIFRTMFLQSGKNASADTQYIILLADFLYDYGLVIFLLIPLVLFGLFKIIFLSGWARKRINKIILRIPFFGKLIRSYYCMHILYSWGLLMRGKVSMIKALNLVNELISNSSVSLSYKDISRALQQGDSISIALKNNQLFEEDILAMLCIGEESGKFDYMLLSAAQIYKDRIYAMISILTTLVQPMLLIFLGIFVLFLISSLYMPIVNLSYAIA